VGGTRSSRAVNRAVPPGTETVRFETNRRQCPSFPSSPARHATREYVRTMAGGATRETEKGCLKGYTRQLTTHQPQVDLVWWRVRRHLGGIALSTLSRARSRAACVSGVCRLVARWLIFRVGLRTLFLSWGVELHKQHTQRVEAHFDKLHRNESLLRLLEGKDTERSTWAASWEVEGHSDMAPHKRDLFL
jgi:hypothetical protein